MGQGSVVDRGLREMGKPFREHGLVDNALKAVHKPFREHGFVDKTLKGAHNLVKDMDKTWKTIEKDANERNEKNKDKQVDPVPWICQKCNGPLGPICDGKQLLRANLVREMLFLSCCGESWAHLNGIVCVTCGDTVLSSLQYHNHNIRD